MGIGGKKNKKEKKETKNRATVTASVVMRVPKLLSVTVSAWLAL